MKNLAVLTMLCFSLICCSKDKYFVNGVQLYDINGNPYKNLNTEIAVSIYSHDNKNELLFNDCKVKNGKLFISLPDIVEDKYLDINYSSYIKWSRIFININDSENNKYITLANKINNNLQDNEIAILYSNGDDTLKSFSLWDSGKIDINVKKGWNILSWYTGENYTGFQSLYDKGYKWYVFQDN